MQVFGVRLSSLIPRVVAVALGPLSEAASLLPQLTVGTGVPSAALPNGSLYLRRDGASTTAIYVRVGGAWVAPLGALADYVLASDLISTAANKGATMVATRAGQPYYPATTVQAALQTIGADIAARATLADLAANGGAALVGTSGSVTVQAALTALQGAVTRSKLASDATSSDNTAGISTGLTHAVVIGHTYVFTAYVKVSAAGTNAIRFSVQETASASSSTCVLTTSYPTGPSAADTGNALTAGAWTANGTGNTDTVLGMVRWLYVCTASGTVTLWVRPETNGSAVTVYAGSSMEVTDFGT